jgi:polysaccharide chain length determinant protein (PEP-CTERM system associated)
MPANSLSLRKPAFLPRSLLRAVWKHKVLGAALALAVSGGGIAAIFELPPIYQAEALILVDPQKIPERFVTSTVNTDIQDRLATINQEVQSSTHLQKIIDEFSLYPKQRLTRTPEEIVELMRKDIQTVLEKGIGGNRPGAFRIIYQGADPIIAARVVDRITNFYIEENHRSRELQAEGTSAFIENQLRDAKKTLDEQELAVAQYKLSHNGELPQQEASLNAALSRLQMELQANQDAVSRAEQSKLLLQGSLAAAEASLAALTRPARALQPTAPAISMELQNQSHPLSTSQEIEAQIAQTRLRYGPSHPDRKRLEAQLEASRRREKEEAANPSAAASTDAPPVPTAPKSSEAEEEQVSEQTTIQRAQINEHIATLKSQVAATEREIQDRRAEGQQILRESTSYQHRIEQLPVRDLQMASLTRNYEFSKAYYNSLLTKKTEAEMATDLEKRQKAETFRVLDPARPPTRPVKPRRKLLSAVSVLVGFTLGIAAAIGRELQAGVLLGEWELPAGTAILGRISHIEPVTSGSDNDGPNSGIRQPARALGLAGTCSALYILIATSVWTLNFFKNV